MWKGYCLEESIWEPTSHLNYVRELIQEFYETNPTKLGGPEERTDASGRKPNKKATKVNPQNANKANARSSRRTTPTASRGEQAEDGDVEGEEGEAEDDDGE